MPSFTDHALLILALLATGGGAVALIAYLWRRWNPLDILPDRSKRSDWINGLACAAILVALFTWRTDSDQRIAAHLEQIERIAAMERAGYLRPDRARAVVNINDCGPRTAGTTDQVLFAIEQQPDGKHITRGCTRIAERPNFMKPAAPTAARTTLVKN